MGVSMLRSTVQYEAAVAAVCRTATCSAARQASITVSTDCEAYISVQALIFQDLWAQYHCSGYA